MNLVGFLLPTVSLQETPLMVVETMRHNAPYPNFGKVLILQHCQKFSIVITHYG
ncbi:MAG: hypothetical protein PHU27_12590 [Salinivirgaceae bacterium]|nr:hypothetical protein [Salinivirgaceae bacterium]